MSLNSVALCGRLSDAGVKLTYLASGSPEAKLTLVVEEPGQDGQQTFKRVIHKWTMISYVGR